MGTINNYFRHLLSSMFDIREGEYRKAVLMQLNIFLIISVLLIVKPTVNSLFLTKFGVEKLPVAFVLVAIAAGIISFFYARVLSRLSLNLIITRTFIWSVLSLIAFGVLLHFNFLEGWILYLFYIWVAIFAVLSASQFWVLANVVFSPREAKRLFGFIGAGAIAGGIFGGYLTSIIAEYIQSENLLFLAAFLLFFCIPITKSIWKKDVVPSLTKFQQKKRTKSFDTNPLALIRRSKHLTYLATIIGLGVIVAKLVDYQFSAIASKNIPDPDDLTAFFGFWFSSFNVISLIVQLFITRKVVGVFGVGTSLYILPFGIMLGAMLVLVFPELWAVIFLKLIDGSLKQSVNKSAMELMVLPIPLEIKNQTKSFIDVFVDSAATGLGGLLLIFVVSGLNISTRFISLIILVLFLVWVYFSRKISIEYIRSFKMKVDQIKDIKSTKAPLDFSKESVISSLIKVLEKGNEKQMVYVLHKIKEKPDDRLFEPIQNLIHHPSAVIRAEAIECLYFFQNHHLVDQVMPFIKDANQQVKLAAFDYLIAHAPENRIELLSRYLKDEDYKVRGAALVSLAIETRNNQDLKEKFDIETILEEKIQHLEGLTDQEEVKFRKIIILKAIAQANFPIYHFLIKKMMHDEDPDIIRQAITSAGNTLNPEFIIELSEFLIQNDYRSQAIAALSNYGPGMIDFLKGVIDNKEWDMERIQQIPSIVERLGNQASVELLFSLLDHESTWLQMEALRSLNILKINHSNLKFHQRMIIKRIMEESHLYLETLSVLYIESTAIDREQEVMEKDGLQSLTEARKNLMSLLEVRLDGHLERIFRLLGLKYPPDDILTIYQSLQSQKEDMRQNAIEFLDSLLEPNLKKILLPILETALIENISDISLKNLPVKIPNEIDCMTLLLATKDSQITLTVFQLISKLNNKKFIPLIAPYTQHENLQIGLKAKEILMELLKD